MLRERPFPPNEIPVPLQQGVGHEEKDDLTEARPSARGQPREFASEHDQHQFLRAGNARSARLLTLKDTELLPQPQDLELLVTLTPLSQPDQVE